MRTNICEMASKSEFIQRMYSVQWLQKGLTPCHTLLYCTVDVIAILPINLHSIANKDTVKTFIIITKINLLLRYNYLLKVQCVTSSSKVTNCNHLNVHHPDLSFSKRKRPYGAHQVSCHHLQLHWVAICEVMRLVVCLFLLLVYILFFLHLFVPSGAIASSN